MSYGTSSSVPTGGRADYGGDMYGDAHAEPQPPTAWQKITHNRWVNLVLLIT